jgi:hypothetical protein
MSRRSLVARELAVRSRLCPRGGDGARRSRLVAAGLRARGFVLAHL